MKSLMLLWKCALDELGALVDVSTARDWKTFTSRVEDEGWSFATITLPSFCKDFERSLELGYIASDAFAGFKPVHRHRGLPVFLSGFLKRVFNPSTGRLLDVSSEKEEFLQTEAIFAVRQLTLMFGKMLLPCSDERVAAAFEGYIECEKEVICWERSANSELLQEFKQVSSLLFSDVLARMDNLVYSNQLHPKHGPGATADKLSGNQKFDQRTWTTRLEDYFPFGEYCLPSWRFNYLLDHVDFLEPGAETPVKVISVPKTLKTPRIIAIEPTCMQYAQQAVSQSLVEELEHSPLLKGAFGAPMIGFGDQRPNQALARLGSLSHGPQYATLDLSEASDRVSNLLVKTLIPEERFPWLHGAVQASRSTRADVPGYGILSIAKFASMGSALCFPIEAMVFTTLCFVGIQRSLNRPITRKDIKHFASSVRVYGDDIIVPKDMTPSVISALESFGFKVNGRKSFWNGLFRESCGKEYWNGHDVSVVKCRRVLPASRTDVQEILSLVSFRNQMYYLGLWKVAKYCDGLIGKILPHFPTVHSESPILGRHTVLSYQTDRMSDYTHSPLVKGYVVVSKPPISTISGEGALLKCLLKRSDLPFADSRHLERQGRPDAVYLKLRWAQPF